jgi:ComF family protein
MNLQKLKETILFLLSVPKCIGCKERLSREDFVFCPKCAEEYKNLINRSCSRCLHKLNSCSCANYYLNTHFVHKVIKVYRYIHREERIPTNELIYSLKRENRGDVLKFLTDELKAAIDNSVSDAKNFVFINVPRRKESIKKYGYDHAKLLAKALAKIYSAVYYQPLLSKSKLAQKKTSGEERIKNANFDLKKNAKSLKGKNVILVDDIITTGASMAACAMLIHGLGANKIIGATVSIAYKDSNIK